MFRVNPFRGRRRWDALLVYYLLEGASAVFFSVAVTLYVIYYARSVGLDAFQIVLMGTVFEVTIFLFEVPTGIVADVYSRRLSIIVGIALIGLAWIVGGSFPALLAILLAEIIQGIGSTFISGATEAWISDEIGLERAGKAFVRAAQIKIVCGMIGIVLSGILASLALNLPFLAAGMCLVILALLLAVVMPENGFKPLPNAERSTWSSLVGTLREGVKLIRLRRVLVTILIIKFIYAFHSEGFDHLWQKYILDTFSLPGLGALNPVVWFSLIALGANLLSIGLHEIVRRRVDLNDHTKTARALMTIYAVVSLGIIAFSLAGNFTVAIAAYWLIAALRGAGEPVSKAWINQHVEPNIRATVFSIKGQTSALGEVVGGPPAGAIASLFSLRASLAFSGVVLAIALPFFAGVLRRPEPSAAGVSQPGD